jgi:predicted nucleotidyltransferase
LVLNILRANLPISTKARVFGSRATGRARRYSDLDLAIDTGRRLTLDEIARLNEAFSESDLPYRVDLVDWQNINDHWRRTIVAERVAITEAR